jgi:hypothetical protein
MRAGVELDRMVAGVVGLKCTHRVLGTEEEYYVDPRDGVVSVPAEFHPSTDLNDAFSAAEDAGVFSNYRVLRTNRRHWEVVEIGHKLDRLISPGETPALAICAAILTLRVLERG